MKLCAIAECGRDASSKAKGARGWCAMHYSRWRRNGDPTNARRYRSGETCSYGTCGLPGNGGRGLCKKHYLRWWKTGEVERAREGKGHQPGPPCGFPACERIHLTHGWCVRHWRTVERHGHCLATARTKNHPASPAIWADLNMARTMQVHGRRRDVEFYLSRAESHGRPLSKVEQSFASGVRMAPDRERDTTQLMEDVMRLTAKGMSARVIGIRLGISERTVIRYRAKAKELENINA